MSELADDAAGEFLDGDEEYEEEDGTAYYDPFWGDAAYQPKQKEPEEPHAGV